MGKIKIVITYGTFDLFHVGHIRLLKRLRKLRLYYRRDMLILCFLRINGNRKEKIL
ncbi:TPA: adenylyltransferase/cytidyltransferase family protein [Vibrio cholerae]|uniref:adenylyltransferase/cytidyltransferase family protein n=1 Tax=Vibrio cholerae TaxID=666 RepID=UPI00383476CD